MDFEAKWLDQKDNFGLQEELNQLVNMQTSDLDGSYDGFLL